MHLRAYNKAKFHPENMKKNKTDWSKLNLKEENLPKITAAAELKPAVILKDVAKFAGKEVSLNGWAYNIRSSGKIMFILFRDGSGDIQIVIEAKSVSKETWETASKLNQESSLQVTGVVTS